MRHPMLAVLTALSWCGGCQPPQPPVVTPTLPPIPVSLPSQMGPVRILVVPEIPTSDSTEMVLGEFLPASRVILLRKGMNLVTTWQVLLHERCHLELYDAGQAMGGPMEEHVCDVWGTADVRVLGPAVGAVLTGAPHG